MPHPQRTVGALLPAARRSVKGWPRSTGMENWSPEVLESCEKIEGYGEDRAPHSKDSRPGPKPGVGSMIPGVGPFDKLLVFTYGSVPLRLFDTIWHPVAAGWGEARLPRTP